MRYPAQLEQDLDIFFRHLAPTDIEGRIRAARSFDLAVTRKACALLNEQTQQYHPDHDFRLAETEMFQHDPELAMQTLQLFTRAIAAKTHHHLTEKKKLAKTTLHKVLRERAIATARLNPVAVVAAKIRGSI